MDDMFFTLETARRLANDVRNGTLVEIPDAKTFVSEDAPESLADAIARFLRK